MHKLGVFFTLLGVVLSVIGLIVGFWKMLSGIAEAQAWLMLVPFGFVGLLLGVTLTQLSRKQ